MRLGDDGCLHCLLCVEEGHAQNLLAIVRDSLQVERGNKEEKYMLTILSASQQVRVRLCPQR